MKAETKRSLEAFLVSPWAVAGLVALAGLIEGGFVMALSFFLAVLIIAYVFLVLIGVPAHFVLKRLGWVNISAYLSVGVIAALIITVLNAKYVGLQVSMAWLPFDLVSFATLLHAGLITAGIAWFIARPDKAGSGLST